MVLRIFKSQLHYIFFVQRGKALCNDDSFRTCPKTSGVFLGFDQFSGQEKIG